MDAEKSLLYQLLTLFSELYPNWVTNLNKRPEKKKLVCEGYRKSIAPYITRDHIFLLEQYLKSSANEKFRTWPPAPLELISIFNLNKKKLQPQPESTSGLSSHTNSDPNREPCVAFLIIAVMMRKQRIEDIPGHVQGYVRALQSYKKHSCYMLFLNWNMLYYRLRDNLPQYDIPTLAKKMFNPANKPFICKELQIKSFDNNELIKFLKETRLNEELYQFLQEDLEIEQP